MAGRTQTRPPKNHVAQFLRHLISDPVKDFCPENGTPTARSRSSGAIDILQHVFIGRTVIADEMTNYLFAQAGGPGVDVGAQKRFKLLDPPTVERDIRGSRLRGLLPPGLKHPVNDLLGDM